MPRYNPRVTRRVHTIESDKRPAGTPNSFKLEHVTRKGLLKEPPGDMYQCSQCGKTFGRLANLHRHERNMHSSAYRRSEVQPPSASSGDVQRPYFHEIVDDDDIFEHGCEVLECETCEMYFLSQDELQKHEKVYQKKLKMSIKNVHQNLSRIKKFYFISRF